MAPRTWAVPDELSDFEAERSLSAFYIYKPSTSSEGKGIFIFRGCDAVQRDTKAVI